MLAESVDIVELASAFHDRRPVVPSAVIADRATFGVAELSQAVVARLALRDRGRERMRVLGVLFRIAKTIDLMEGAANMEQGLKMPLRTLLTLVVYGT
jgi:hypothetical protein